MYKNSTCNSGDPWPHRCQHANLMLSESSGSKIDIEIGKQAHERPEKGKVVCLEDVLGGKDTPALQQSLDHLFGWLGTTCNNICLVCCEVTCM